MIAFSSRHLYGPSGISVVVADRYGHSPYDPSRRTTGRGG
jgi:hypothetical protein